MPIKPIDRLLFAQGGLCFFCEKPLPKAEASVEHLVAVTHGGKDSNENCVACCKALNALFGRMSLKEKLQIVLRQRGRFVCPAAKSTAPHVAVSAVTEEGHAGAESPDTKLQIVITDLQKRGAAKPGTLAKLKNTMKNALGNGETDESLDALAQQLQEAGLITVSKGKVTYAFPPRAL